MHSYIKLLILAASLTAPGAISAQEHRDDRRYEDKKHKDSHEWNDREDQAYRRYLQQHHKKYYDFEKAKMRNLDNYWNWRHSHPGNDHR